MSAVPPPKPLQEHFPVEGLQVAVQVLFTDDEQTPSFAADATPLVVSDAVGSTPGNTIRPTWSWFGHNSLSNVCAPASAHSILVGFLILPQVAPVSWVVDIDDVLSIINIILSGGNELPLPRASDFAVSVTDPILKISPKVRDTFAVCVTRTAFDPAFGPVAAQ